jgi:hypothetical protein
MSPLFPLLFIGGAYLVMRGGSARGPAGSGASKASPSGTDGKCITPPRTDFNDLPDEGFWNAFKYALWVDSDPKSLEEFAASCDAVCQPEAARVLRQKAKDLRALGVPDGYSPNGKPPVTAPTVSLPMPDGPVQIPVPPTYDPTGAYKYLPPDVIGGVKIPESFPFPVPGIEGTPEPPPNVVVPPVVPGIDLPTPEIPQDKSAPPPDVPKADCRSNPDTQWWTLPVKAGESPWSITQAWIGDGKRYPELIAANPEKATVGTKGNADYTFASLKVGERLRVPKTWNVYVDKTGRTDGKGKIWPVCEGSGADTAAGGDCWKGFTRTGNAMADLKRLADSCAAGMDVIVPASKRAFKEGEQVEIAYPLVPGVYRFIAVGDMGVSSVTLELFDPSGIKISADLTGDAYPILGPYRRVAISKAGVYKLVISVKKGSGEVAGAAWRLP